MTDQRYARERAFFDAKAKLRSDNGIHVDQLVDALRLEAGVSAGSAQDYAIRLLSHIAGLKVLDVGAGEGWATLHFASLGASVTATDVSGEALWLLRARAERLRLNDRIQTVLVDTDTQPFPSGAFDVVFCNAVLHHLHLGRAVPEIRRVLRSGGVAVFMEPLADHPLVRLYRLLTPGRRTKDERPLSWTEVMWVAKSFARVDMKFFELVALPTLALRHTPLLRWLEFLHAGDDWLFRTLPWSRRFSRAVVLRVEND